MSFWNPYSLGLDFGTSGARAIAINAEGHIVSESRGHWAAGDCANPQAWRDALETLLSSIPLTIRQQLQRISINGTSGTVLLCDGEGNPITDPLLYNDDRGKSVQEQLHALAPPHHLVQSSTSSLAKLLYWHTQGLWDTQPPTSWQLLHQADWLALFLHGQPRYSDYHNALKLGYDVVHLTYPDWLRTAPFASLLPQVIAPGSPIAPILPEQAQRWDLSPHCWICAGTTDSIAAFLASGVTTVGEAVTSLGSTLVLKLLSDQYVTDLSLGIYSHRLGNQWLVGGASNSGGAVLRHFFSSEELHTLSEHINPQNPTRLDYYPLLTPGERFPHNDPDFAPRLTPRPEDPVIFLQGLLEGMAQIEHLGYQCLQERGAPALQRVYTAGGGAQNAAWTAIRHRTLGVPISPALHQEAAYGTARLAQGLLERFMRTVY